MNEVNIVDLYAPASIPYYNPPCWHCQLRRSITQFQYPPLPLGSPLCGRPEAYVKAQGSGGVRCEDQVLFHTWQCFTGPARCEMFTLIPGGLLAVYHTLCGAAGGSQPFTSRVWALYWGYDMSHIKLKKEIPQFPCRPY